jgi:hypothetical protein
MNFQWLNFQLGNNFPFWSFRYLNLIENWKLKIGISRPSDERGRGAFHVQWSSTGKLGGANGSENAGLSSALDRWESYPPNSQGFRRKVRPRRVSRYLRRGQNGVVDGRQVKIPVFVLYRQSVHSTQGIVKRTENIGGEFLPMHSALCSMFCMLCMLAGDWLSRMTGALMWYRSISYEIVKAGKSAFVINQVVM